MIKAGVVQSRNLQANITALRKVVPELAKHAVNEHALNVQARAKEFVLRGSPSVSLPPANDTGRLASSIKIEWFQNGLAARVGTDVIHGPFVEFGTGPRSKMPPIEPIRQWCRRHGIPESAAYPIALAIMRRGTPAKPFLFPAYEIERPIFEGHIRTALQKLRLGPP